MDKNNKNIIEISLGFKILQNARESGRKDKVW